MESLKRIGGFLDWLGRVVTVVTVFQVLAALGLGTAFRALLSTRTTIDPSWITPLWLLASIIILWLLIILTNKFKKPASAQTSAMPGVQSAVTISSLVGVPVLAPTFDSAHYFRVSYHSPLTAEVEKNIRLVANHQYPKDEAGFLCKLIGVGLVEFLHNLTWSYVYKSQLLMLLELNRVGGLMPIAQARGFYDTAATLDPKAYAAYSFGQWLGFVKSQQLIIEHPSGMLEITHRGKDFLKFLTHWGAYPDKKGL